MQAFGKDIEKPIYVEELGTTLSRDEIYKVLVLDIMEGAIEVDWRDFFPYLRWIPNKRLETKIQRLYFRRKAVMTALINEQKKRIASGEVLIFFLFLILSINALSLTLKLHISCFSNMTGYETGSQLLYRLLA